MHNSVKIDFACNSAYYLGTYIVLSPVSVIEFLNTMVSVHYNVPIFVLHMHILKYSSIYAFYSWNGIATSFAN